MKKLLLISFALMITSNLFAQTNNGPIYVIFTSTTEHVPKGVVFGTGYDSTTDRSPRRSYYMVDMSEDYFYTFLYFNKKKDPENPIRSISFLELGLIMTAYHSIDWDAIGPTLTKAQAAQKIEEIKSHEKIYFIDRREFENNMFKLVPVKMPESAF